MLASSGVDLKLHHWPPAGLELIYQPKVTAKITSISWSNDNSYMCFSDENGRAEVVGVRANSVKHALTLSCLKNISAVAYQRTAKRNVAVATTSGQVTVFDIRNKNIPRIFQNVPFAINLIDFNACDENLAMACKNGSVVVQRMLDGTICGNYVLSSVPTAMRYHPTEPYILATATSDGTVMLWDTKVGKKNYCAQTHTAPVTGIALNGNSIITVGGDHKFCIHDLTINECTFRSNVQQPLSAVDIHSDGITLAIASKMGTIYIYDLRNFLVPIASWGAHDTEINKILFENKTPPEYIDDSLSEVSSSHTIRLAEGKINEKYWKMMCETQQQKPEAKPDLNDTNLENLANTSSFTKTEQAKTLPLKTLKDEVLMSIRKSAEDVHYQLSDQFENLRNFFSSEFHTINNQMEDNWDMLNLPTQDPSHLQIV